jgi:chromosome partitioning protein
MAWIIGVGGNKGGPGKTAESVALTYELARRGLNVALCDLDPQGNATRRLSVNKAALIAAGRPGIAELLDPRKPAKVRDAAVVCGWPDEAAQRITVVPSLDRESLSERAEEAAKPGAATRLRRALSDGDWTDEFHVVLVDLGPHVDHLLHMAMAAIDRLLLVTTLNHDSLEGAVYLADYVDRQREAFERDDLEVCGVIVNAYDDDSAKQNEHLANLAQTFAPWGGDDLIWGPPVPYRLSLANSHDDAVPVSTIRHMVVKELAGVYEAHGDRVVAMMQEAVPA